MSSELPHAVRPFISSLLDPADIVELRSIWPDRQAGKGATSTWATAGALATDAACLTPLRAANRAGWGIYIGANPRKEFGGTDAKSVALARSLFVDFDGGCSVPDALDRVRLAGLPEPTVVVASGHGVHVYWRLVTPLLDLGAWTERQKALISRLGSDKAIHDPPRVMRVPGFLNTKPPAAPCVLVEAHPERRVEIAAFPAPVAAPKVAMPTPALGRAEPSGLAGASRRTIELIRTGAPVGGRHHAAVSAACDLAGCGFSQHEAERLLAPSLVCDGPDGFTLNELRDVLRWAFARPRTPARTQPPSPSAQLRGGLIWIFAGVRSKR